MSFLIIIMSILCQEWTCFDEISVPWRYCFLKWHHLFHFVQAFQWK